MTELKIIDFLQQELKAKEISNYQAAKNAGLSRSTIKRIFEKENSPALENIIKIAEIAGFELTLTKIKNGK